MSAQASGHAAHPETKVSSGDVLLFPLDFPLGDEPRAIRFGTLEVFECPDEFSLLRRIRDNVLFFSTREEAVLHWESRGISPTEIPFEPDFNDALEGGNVRPYVGPLTEIPVFA